MKRASRSALVATMLLFGANCTEDDAPTSPEGDLLPGTWGGENVALIVEEDVAHVHFGCTNGDFSAPIHVDAEGRFSVPGSYMLRAYPIPIGPTVPAQMAGQVRGRRVTFSVAVNDTVMKELIVFGPSTVIFGQEPQMGPCPICVRGRGQRATGRLQRAEGRGQRAE
jgi:hypothetical protein